MKIRNSIPVLLLLGMHFFLSCSVFPTGPVNRTTYSVVFAAGTGTSTEIYSINPDSTDLKQLTNTGTLKFDPTFSPDGSKIAFVSSIPYHYEIFTMDSDGSNQLKVTFTSDRNRNPAWSPDGTKIAFTRNEIINVINEDGSGLISLNVMANQADKLVWSPDGTKIAYILHTELHIVNTDGTDQLRLFDDIDYAFSPGFSAVFTKNSMQIYFIGSNKQLYSINIDGSGLENIGSQISGFGEFQISPNLNKIAFVDRVGVFFEIYLMNLDGSGKEQLTFTNRNDFPYLNKLSLSWSPDSDYLTFFHYHNPPISSIGWTLKTLKIDGARQTILAQSNSLDQKISWSIR